MDGMDPDRLGDYLGVRGHPPQIPGGRHCVWMDPYKSQNMRNPDPIPQPRPQSPQSPGHRNGVSSFLFFCNFFHLLYSPKYSLFPQF